MTRPDASLEAVNEILEHLRAENAQDLDALLEGMTDDCFNAVVGDPSSPYVGPERVTTRYSNLFSAFPDIRIEIRRLVSLDVENHVAVSENFLSGTHGGTLFGVPASGNTVGVRALVIWDLGEDYKIKGETVFLDLLTMMRQVGHLKLSAAGD